MVRRHDDVGSRSFTKPIELNKQFQHGSLNMYHRCYVVELVPDSINLVNKDNGWRDNQL